MSALGDPMYSFDKMNQILQTAATVGQLLAGDAESLTLRHNGLVVVVPLKGNADKTIRQIARENSIELAIPGGTQPSATSPGVGDVDIETKPTAGQTVDLFTDKKENASS